MCNRGQTDGRDNTGQLYPSFMMSVAHRSELARYVYVHTYMVRLYAAKIYLYQLTYISTHYGSLEPE